MTIILLDAGGDVGFSLSYEKGVLCITGRHTEEKESALLGYNLRFFTLDLGEGSYSYTVQVVHDKCLAGVVYIKKERENVALVLYKRDLLRVIKLPFKGGLMLWQVLRTDEGFILVGGIRERDWDAFIAKLSRDFKVIWSRRLDFSEEYFYSVEKAGGVIYAVGRIKRKDWDGLIVEFTEEGKILESYTLGGAYKDYLRFVNEVNGKVIAVGRSEDEEGDSDLLVYDFGSYYLYDIGEYDYGRAVSEYGRGFIVAGETRFRGNNDGLFLILDDNFKPMKAYRLGWEGTDAVRFMDFPFFTGYTYSFSFNPSLLFGIFSEDMEETDVKEVKRKLELERVKMREVIYLKLR
ncbi:hypothetical protein JCM9492_14840 [Aquifex pyrophilus]